MLKEFNLKNAKGLASWDKDSNRRRVIDPATGLYVSVRHLNLELKFLEDDDDDDFYDSIPSTITKLN